MAKLFWKFSVFLLLSQIIYVLVIGVTSVHGQSIKRGSLRKLEAEELQDEDILSVAQFAASTIAKQENRKFHESVLLVTEGKVQTVAGRRLKLRIKLTSTNCPIHSDFNKDKCPPTNAKIIRMCDAEIYERPWEHFTELAAFSCA